MSSNLDTTSQRSSALLNLWLQEQTERHQKGLCVFCGLPLRECWCGEDEPVEYRPVEGSDADRAAG